MQISNLFSDDRAVSPVIGVILMVAITVILAAVIGTFVLGLGDQLGDNAPSASYDWDQDGTAANGDLSSLTVEHASGENIDEETLTASVNGQSNSTLSNAWADDGTVSAGDVLEFDDLGEIDLSNVDEDDTARITWEAPGGGSSSTLTNYDVN